MQFKSGVVGNDAIGAYARCDQYPVGMEARRVKVRRHGGVHTRRDMAYPSRGGMVSEQRVRGRKRLARRHGFAELGPSEDRVRG